MKTHHINQLHISWHIAFLSGGIVLGIALAGYLHMRYIGANAGILALFLLACCCWRQTRRLAVVALTAGVLLGVWRGSAEQQALLTYQPLYNRVVTVTGIVSEDASYGANGDQRLQLSNARVDTTPVHGKIWVSIQEPADIKRSDKVTVHGQLAEGFGNLPATMKRAQLIGIERPHPGDIARHVRDWFTGGIHLAIPEPQAALGIGYLVGQHAAMPQTLTDQIKIVGLTHAVVASGYNLTILVGFARRAFMRVSKFVATLAGGLMTAAFMLVTGLSPSMTRAGLVTGLSLVAWYYGRKVHPLVLLPFAAALTAFINPAYVWGDIGWFLSFASFAGVLLLAPLMHQYFWGAAEPNTFRQILVETSSAQLATTPIILFAFGSFSTYALLANMLVLPLIPFAMLLTFLAGVASLCFPNLAHLAGWPAHTLLQYMTSVIAWVAKLPNASAAIQFNLGMLIAGYAILTIGCLCMRSKTAYSFRNARNVTIGERT